jgi:hypothetical protein
VPAGDYLVGAVLLLAVLAPAVAGTVVLLRKRCPELAGAERLTAGGVIATAGLLAIHLLPAALGLLGRGSVMVCAFAWLAACLAVPARPARPDAAEPRQRRTASEDRFATPLALVAAAMAGVFFLTFVLDQATTPSRSVDFMNFHLPSVLAWIHDGSLWSVESWLPAVAPGHYPNTGDAMILVAVLPWHNDFLAHAAIWPFFALTGVATYALALAIGARRPAAIVAGALTFGIPVVAVSAVPHGITDSVMLFGFAAGGLFLIRHHRSGLTADLALAGIALGISFGTKWYGVSAVAIVVAVWAAARLFARVPWTTVVRQTAMCAGLVALVGGVWLVRNLVESGNPVFPVEVAPFGVTLFDAPPDVTRELAGFTIADYLGDWDPWWKLEGNPELQGFVLDGILLQWWHSLAAPGLLALVGGAWAAVLVLNRRLAGHRRGIAAAAVVAMGLIICAYVVTPYTAGGPEDLPLLVGADSRYVVPALVIGIALAAWAASRVRWGSVAFAAAAIAALVHGFAWAGRGELSPAELDAGNWIGALALVFVAGLCYWAVEPWWGRLGAGGRRDAVAAAASVALVGVVAGGQAIQAEFNDDRYAGSDPVVDAVVANPEGRKIGLASVWTDSGISPILPSFGERFENEVEYVGPIVDEMQQSYEERDEFVAAIEDGDYDALIVGRGRPELPEPEVDDWVRSAGWTLAGRSDRLELFLPPSRG